MRAWARASADCGSRWPAGGAGAVTADCATTTPPVMASNTAPDNRNKTPYSAVSRSRTLRRASSIRIARLPRLVLAPTGPATGSPPPGCPARPNSEITATVRPMLWPLPYNQVTGSSPGNSKEHEHERSHRGRLERWGMESAGLTRRGFMAVTGAGAVAVAGATAPWIGQRANAEDRRGSRRDARQLADAGLAAFGRHRIFALPHVHRPPAPPHPPP